MAFAGPDLEMDFEGHKDHAVDEELGINEKRNKILSQGNNSPHTHLTGPD